MRRFILALAACAALFGGAAQPAVAQSTAPATDADFARQTNTWVTAIGSWANSYNSIIYRQAELLNALNEGAGKAFEFSEGRNARAGKAWAATWAAEQRATLAAIKADLAALPRQPPSLKGPGYDLTGVPLYGRLSRGFERVPTMTDEMMATVDALALKYIDATVRAAGGDEEAAGVLGIAFFDINIASWQADIKMLEGYLPLFEISPSLQEQVTTTAIALDRSLIAVFEIVRDDALGAPVDRAAAAARVRAQAALIDGDAAETAAGVVTLRRQASDPRAGELGPKILAIGQAYDDGRAVMAELAGRLRSIADGMDRGDALDRDKLLEITEQIAPALEKFGELDQRRKALLVQ